MSDIDFLIPEGGVGKVGCNIKSIKIPKECCGFKTELGPALHSDYHTNTIKSTCCSSHINSYYSIWTFFGPGGPLEIKKSSFIEEAKKIIDQHTAKYGCHCIKCGMNNQYAVPNTDKGYVCFECRI